MKDGHLEFSKGANATRRSEDLLVLYQLKRWLPQDPGEEPVKTNELTPPVKPETRPWEVPTGKPVPPTEP